jgi:hypothetical protein
MARVATSKLWKESVLYLILGGGAAVHGLAFDFGVALDFGWRSCSPLR